MKKLFSNIPFLISLVVFGLISTYVINQAISYYNSKEIPFLEECIVNKNISIENFIQDTVLENISSSFDYDGYFNKGNYCNYKSIISDIRIIDSLSNDFYGFTEPFIYILLSDSLINKSFNDYDSKKILLKLNWVRSMKYYSELNEQTKYLFLGVYDRWMQKIVWLLSDELKKNKDMRYNYNWNLIASQCKLEGYYVPQKLSNKEKTVNYFIEGKYTYIFNKISNYTNIYMKILILVAALFSIYCLMYTTKNIIIKIKKLRK